jgi:hypothetical protein
VPDADPPADGRRLVAYRRICADTCPVTEDSKDAPARSPRQRVGGIAAACWASLIVLRFLRDAVDWRSHGVPYWIVYAPLAVGSVGGGLLWLILAVRDVLARRHALPPGRELASGDHRADIPAASEFSAVEIIQEDRITRRAWRKAREVGANDG